MSNHPFHLPPSQNSFSEPGIITKVFITQNNLDGLQALLTWCEGFSAAKNGTIPGYYEVSSFYQSIQTAIHHQLVEDKKKAELAESEKKKK